MKKTKIKKDLSNKLKEIGSGSKIRGITLISLIVTIIVLLILAGVTINLAVNNQGIFNKAKTAKEMYTNAQNYEETEIEKITNSIDSYTSYVANGTVKAEDVGYTNPNWAGITNVKQALDYLYNN